MKHTLSLLSAFLLLQAAPAYALTLEEELAATQAEFQRESRAMGEMGGEFQKDAEAGHEKMNALNGVPEGMNEMTPDEIAGHTESRLQQAQAVQDRGVEFIEKQQGHIQRVRELSARIVELQRQIRERDAAAKAEAARLKEAEGVEE